MSTEVEQLSAAERALEAASTPAEVKEIYDLAEAYRVYASSAKEQNRAATFKLRAGAKGGQMLKEDPLLGKGKSARLADLFPDETPAAREHVSKLWQRLTNLEKLGTLAAYLEAAEAAEPEIEITFAGLINYWTTGILTSSASPEWYTPAKYIDAAREALGGSIDLDPASSSEANEVVRATRFYTAEDNGLLLPWHGTVFLNPPYGSTGSKGATTEFVSKLNAEYQAGRTTAAVALTSSRSTDAGWFQLLWPHTLCFTDHRIPFWTPDRDAPGDMFGGTFTYLGPEPERFAARFAVFGPIVRKWPA